MCVNEDWPDGPESAPSYKLYYAVLSYHCIRPAYFKIFVAIRVEQRMERARLPCAFHCQRFIVHRRKVKCSKLFCHSTTAATLGGWPFSSFTWPIHTLTDIRNWIWSFFRHYEVRGSMCSCWSHALTAYTCHSPNAKKKHIEISGKNVLSPTASGVKKWRPRRRKESAEARFNMEEEKKKRVVCVCENQIQ